MHLEYKLNPNCQLLFTLVFSELWCIFKPPILVWSTNIYVLPKCTAATLRLSLQYLLLVISVDQNIANKIYCDVGLIKILHLFENQSMSKMLEYITLMLSEKAFDSIFREGFASLRVQVWDSSLKSWNWDQIEKEYEMVNLFWNIWHLFFLLFTLKLASEITTSLVVGR